MPDVKTLTRNVIALLTLLSAIPAAAQNRLTNSQFNGTIAGWAKSPDAGSGTLAYDASRDANSSHQSGSAAFASTTAAKSKSSWLTQCFLASPGEKLVWGGYLRFRTGETTTGTTYTILRFFPTPSCSGEPIYGVGGPIFSTAAGRGVWRDAGGSGMAPVGQIAPAGTVSVQLVVAVYKLEAGGVLTVNADKLFVALDGSPRCDGQVPTLVGSDGPDTLYGTPGTDIIMGLGGPDEIFGRGGFDTICGGGGADTIDGGPGGDVLLGGAGEDVLLGGGGGDLLIGGGGNDDCTGGAGNDLAAECEITTSIP